MNFQLSKNLIPGTDLPQKIYSIAWSPNMYRLAICQSSDKKVILFDEQGNKKEAFSTKPFKTSKNYGIKDLAFSADSTKLAIAQTDNIVFIYNLGSKWGDRKTICNKLEQEDKINCMIWPVTKPYEMYIGLINGKVKVGLLKSNSSTNLYSGESLVVSLACSVDGKYLISGHLDGYIYKFNLENSNLQKLVLHPSIPYCLSWGNDILACGNDNKVFFYNDSGNKLKFFDYSDDEKYKEFTVSKTNSVGDCIAIGNYNRFVIFMYNKRMQRWEESCVKSLEGLYSVSALCWKPDGSALVTGNLTGSVDIFEAFVSKKILREKFEVIYITPHQILVKNIERNKKVILKPKQSTIIMSFKLYKDNFVILTTKESIMFADIEGEKCSEIVWSVNGKEKFDFNNPGVCMIYSSGELTLIEYGNDEVVGYCRSEYIHNDLISCRIKEKVKIISFLIDLNTIYVQDLNSQTLLTSVSHEEKIDYLELNKTGTKLIFRDRKKQLFLFNLHENKRSTLLNYCGFVKWVPNSEVLVAQDLKNMCIWYNVDDADKVKITPIRGNITEINRIPGKTEVVVNEGVNSQIYLLDDGLISFSTAIDENDLEKAMRILEALEMNSDTETHWKTLAKNSIHQKKLLIAQRCYAAIGSYPKANYIKKVIDVAQEKGIDHPLVEAKLLILDKQFKNAEALLLNNGLLNEAMDILNELQKWDVTVQIAEDYRHPSIEDIKKQYYSWLIENDQLDKAATIKEQEGDLNSAIKHYIKGGYPAKAATLVKTHGIDKFDSTTLEHIVKSLLHVGIFEKAGELLEQMSHFKRSLEAYQKGYCYSKAVELAKKNMPSMVEKLEEEWGDYLSSQRHNEAAIIHYQEANCKGKAIEAAIEARKWEKAIDLANKSPSDVSKPFYAIIGDHFAALHKMDQAEKFYLKSDEPILCLSMYIRYNKWDKAEQLVKKYLQTEYHKQLISQEAENFEKNGRLKEAEKLYLLAEDYDVAITMYMENKQYDNMLRLVGIHRPDYLQDTHLKVANLICAETNANLKQAELHFIEANAWSECFDMYKNHDLWEDALRIAKSHGGREEVNAKAKEIVKDLPPLKQKETLLQMGMIDALIDIEIANNNFDEAKKLAKQHAKYKLPDVHYKYAIVLEDERRYHESELEFIEAGQPMEAIKMYEYIFDFMSALRVARQHSPENILPIFLNQGKYMLEKKDFKKAEFCFVSGKKPDIMAAYYLKEKMIAEGEEFCRKHYPIMLPEFCRTDEVDPDALNGDQLLKMVKNKLQTYDYHGAADLLLRANKSHFSDTDKLSEEWEKAIHIVSEYERNRYSEVLIIVAQKQRDLGLFKKAAEKFKSEGYWEDAVYCYMEVDMFNQCYEIISKLPEGQLKVKLNKLVSEEHKKKRGDIGPEGLELLFHQRQYEKCLEAAMKLSDEMFNKYLFKIVEAYIIDKSYIGAADLLERYETPINKNNLNWYKELSEEILAEENIDELKSLKNMLNCCLKHLVNYQEFANEMKYLARLHKISYYQYLKANMKNNQNFNYSYYHLSIAVLSYGDIIKFDQALYDAGTFARDQGQKGIAFILLDRYLDIYEIINDPQSKLEFKKEFDKTDIPQSDPFIGQQNILSNEEKEKLQTWIVKTSVDKNIDFTFPQKDCAKCKKKIFEYNTSCHHCGYQYDQCIITGYPINTQSDTIKCSNCNKKALKEAWKEWISNKERCPWCDSIQISYK